MTVAPGPQMQARGGQGLAGVLFLVVAVGAYMGLLRLDAREAWVTRTALDRGAPLWPWMVWIYLSPYLLGPIVVVGLDGASFRRLLSRAAAMLVILLTSFAAFPTRVERPTLPEAGDRLTLQLLHALYRMDAPPRNALPSGHAALAVFIGWAAVRAGVPALLVVPWSVAVVVSTVLTGQHHVLDPLVGTAVAVAVLIGMARAEHRAAQHLP